MTNANWGYGAILTRAGNPIAELKSINGPTEKADALDVTVLNSTGGFREFIAGLKDGGEVSMEGNLYVGDTLGQVAMHSDLAAGTVRAYVLTFPTAMGATFTFNALVTAWETGTPVDNAVPFKGTVKITGVPALNITGSNNTSAMTGTEETGGAALDFVPNYAAAKYEYTTALINTLSTYVIVNVTFAAGAGSVTCLGVTQTLVSTVNSGPIVIGAANTTTDVVITIKETNKMATVYTIHVPRP
jgi:predicted secreted protein